MNINEVVRSECITGLGLTGFSALSCDLVQLLAWQALLAFASSIRNDLTALRFDNGWVGRTHDLIPRFQLGFYLQEGRIHHNLMSIRPD